MATMEHPTDGDDDDGNIADPRRRRRKTSTRAGAGICYGGARRALGSSPFSLGTVHRLPVLRAPLDLQLPVSLGPHVRHRHWLLQLYVGRDGALHCVSYYFMVVGGWSALFSSSHP